MVVTHFLLPYQSSICNEVLENQSSHHSHFVWVAIVCDFFGEREDELSLKTTINGKQWAYWVLIAQSPDFSFCECSLCFVIYITFVTFLSSPREDATEANRHMITSETY